MEKNKKISKKGTPAKGKFGFSLVANPDKYLPFFLFLVFVGLVYIWNTHRAIKKIKRLDQLTAQVRDIKSEYTTLAADLSYGTKQSMLAPSVDSLGLRKLNEPPFKIRATNE